MTFHNVAFWFTVLLQDNCEGDVTIAAVVFPGVRLTRVVDNV